MNSCIQYHNWPKRGLPWPTPRSRVFSDSKSAIFTTLPFVRDEVGSQVYLIVGLGKTPRRYFLWETFTIEKVRKEGDDFVASGSGWMLNPPQELSGKDFDEFRKQCANFIGFKNVSSLTYTKQLVMLAEKYRRSAISRETLKFCEELVSLLPDDDDATELLKIAARAARQRAVPGPSGSEGPADEPQTSSLRSTTPNHRGNLTYASSQRERGNLSFAKRSCAPMDTRAQSRGAMQSLHSRLRTSDRIATVPQAE